MNRRLLGDKHKEIATGLCNLACVLQGKGEMGQRRGDCSSRRWPCSANCSATCTPTLP